MWGGGQGYGAQGEGQGAGGEGQGARGGKRMVLCRRIACLEARAVTLLMVHTGGGGEGVRG